MKVVDYEHRVRLLRIPLRVLIEFAYTQEGLPDYVSLFRPPLPAGTKVIGMPHVDPLTSSLSVLIHHPLFEPVPDGGIPPVHEEVAGGTWEVHALATKEELTVRRAKLGAVMEEIGPESDEPHRG